MGPVTIIISHVQIQINDNETRVDGNTRAVIPAGYRNLLYSVSTVSSGSTTHLFCSRMGPVSSPSSAQKIVNPAFLSPCINVLFHT